jgi:opacity protein-like surface antigen
MKRTALVALALLVLGGTASAQMSPMKLYAGLGMGLPKAADRFADNYKTGFGAMAGVGLSVFPKLEAVPKLEYFSFNNDIDLFGGGKISIIMFGVDGKLNLGIPTMPMKPYLLGGAGLAKFSMADLDLPTNPSNLINDLADAVKLEDQTKLYYNIGGGVEWKFLVAVSIFAQGRYVQIATDGDPTTFWALNAGVKLL